MQQNLILYISNEGPIQYLDPNHQTLETISADVLYNVIPNSKIIVFVPAEDVLVTTIKLPKLSRNKLHEAIPFALEEQLINELDELHFAAWEYQHDYYPVAIVNHQKMQTWLKELANLGVKPDVIMPISLTLPTADTVCNVSIVNEIAIICLSRFSIYTSDRKNLEGLLQLVVEDHTELESVMIHNYSNQPCANDLKSSLTIVEHSYPPNQILSAWNNQISLNLLQHKYAPKKSNQPKVKKMWWAAAVCASFIFLSLLIYPTISYWILQKKYAAIEGEIKSIYKRNFPLATSVVSPRLRLEEKLKKLNANPKDAQLFLNLAALGTALRDANVKLNRIDFQSNQLTAALTATSSEDLANLISLMEQQGLQIRQQSAAMAADRMNATIVIE